MKIFIVPYRDRPYQLKIFLNQMRYILEDISKEDYKIYIMHQADKRPFNRGAMRNLGFVQAKKEYPDTYKDIDLIFHDLDNLIGEKNLVQFETNPGEVNHIFGNYKDGNLGGIWVIKGGDFEKTNGYPNFWGWGWEDALIVLRVHAQTLKIVQGKFNYHDKRVVHLDFHPMMVASEKILNQINRDVYEQKQRTKRIFPDGIDSLRNVEIKSKEIVEPQVEKWNISSFATYLPPTTMKETKIWIVAPNLASWLQNNYQQIRVRDW